MFHIFLLNILNSIANHPHTAYVVIFLISLSESLALVGLLVPGTLLMFGVGAVIATGSLSLKPTLVVAMAGAIAGDGISYWFGHHYHQRLKDLWPFNRHPRMLSRGETFFHRHGGKSILFGRFIGPVRPVIPIVAGMLDMSPLKFTLVNVLSAIGWAFAYILPGVFFGTSLALAGRVSARLTVLILLVVGTIWAFVWLCRKLLLFVEYFVPRWLASLEDWITCDTTLSRVMSSLRRFLSFVFLREKGEEFLFAFLVLVLFLTGWGFLGVLQDVVARDPLVRADQAVYHLFQSLRTPWGDHIFVAITELGDSMVNICIASAVLLMLLLKRCYRTAGYWLLTIIGGLLGVQLLKWMLHLPRPVVLYHGISAFGFPSGHTTMSVILYGFLAILIAKGLFSTLRAGLFITVFLISFVIAFSRLYLGVHWLSDVLGGFLIGTSWTALFGIAYLKGPAERIPRRLLVLVTMVVILTAGAWHVAQRHEKDLAFYATRHAVESMPLQKWIDDGWIKLPAWRIDLGGEPEQPITIQWAGSCEDMAKYLLATDWRRPPSLNLKNLLGMLSPDTPIEQLPVLPHLHDGRVDSMRLVRQADGQRWVLRLWPADVRITKNDTPLFVGTIEIQNRRHMAGLITAARDTGEYDRPLNALEQALDDRSTVKSVSRAGNEIQVNREHRRLHWRGKVLLVWEKADL